MARVRALIKQAVPKATEEIKYRTKANPAGVPCWYHNGMICTGETYKEHLRFTFSKGRALKKDHDPKGVLNNYTAITLREVDILNETAFKQLIKAAVALNNAPKAAKAKKRT